jgi:histidinol-phosphate aminotransferase
MSEYQQLLRPDIRAMDPYTPILPFEILSRQLNRDPADIIKLDANENPYGPAPKSRQALAELTFTHIYPDPETRLLRAALEDFTGVPADRLLAGAGADELIDLVLRALLAPGDVVLNCPPSFGMYPFSTAVNMGKVVSIPRRPDFRLDIAGIAATIQEHPAAKVLFVCSPNNPDGSLIADADLERLLALPLVVVLDEAYVEFVSGLRVENDYRPASRIHWTQEFDNLVVLRTFSKWAGLAGLRVGYGAFPTWLLPHLWKIKQPYNVNVAAEKAARAALADRPWLQDKLERLIAARHNLQQELATIAYLEPFPSQANFVLCRVTGRDALALKNRLAAEGILVRYFAKPGLENCLRISTGRPEDNDRLLAVLKQLEKSDEA